MHSWPLTHVRCCKSGDGPTTTISPLSTRKSAGIVSPVKQSAVKFELFLVPRWPLHQHSRYCPPGVVIKGVHQTGHHKTAGSVNLAGVSSQMSGAASMKWILTCSLDMVTEVPAQRWEVNKAITGKSPAAVSRSRHGGFADRIVRRRPSSM